jgi:2'-5' RNA ligase
LGAKARFFYALRPDPRAATELGRLAARLAAGIGGRPLAGDDVHLTLAFVGERPAADAPALHALLIGLAPHWPPLPLERLGSFGRGLWWTGPADSRGAGEAATPQAGATTGAAQPPWPARLADELHRRLDAAGIAFDRRPLHLHATLVRGARRDANGRFPALDDALPIAPLHWSLTLGWSDAESTPQRRYRWREAPG